MNPILKNIGFSELLYSEGKPMLFTGICDNTGLRILRYSVSPFFSFARKSAMPSAMPFTSFC